mmetsp:Transcript_21663/g.46817  ORF Transcript_21663/g.46817 Transcript_21663/m.46817 type:complete len:83 (+) Transcript_21663:345-593(+)
MNKSMNKTRLIDDLQICRSADFIQRPGTIENMVCRLRRSIPPTSGSTRQEGGNMAYNMSMAHVASALVSSSPASDGSPSCST